MYFCVKEVLKASLIAMKKLYIFAILALAGISAGAQTYLKVNAPSTLLGIPQIAVETTLYKNITLQGDILGSYWESINGAPFKTVMAFAEGRYHINGAYNGLYFGGHIGGAVFELQKWNYLNTNKYQKGYAIFMGVTVGYQFKINEKLMIDMFIGGGNQQANYKGYYIGTDERYEHVRHYNRSGEWIPYRGGIMFSYRL